MAKTRRPPTGLARPLSKRKPRGAPLKPAYSGDRSHEFWQRVNELPDEAVRRELYACGVLLQNMEGTVLNWLHAAERQVLPPARGR